MHAWWAQIVIVLSVACELDAWNGAQHSQPAFMLGTTAWRTPRTNIERSTCPQHSMPTGLGALQFVRLSRSAMSRKGAARHHPVSCLLMQAMGVDEPEDDHDASSAGDTSNRGGREQGLEGERLPFGRFENLDISEQSLRRLKDLDLQSLSPIQRKTFQPIMQGRDIIAKAPTGTGKTLAYCLPAVERLLLMPPRGRAPTRPSWLVLVPTRELAQQVTKELNGIAGKRLTTLLAVGGVAMDPQIEALQRGVDVVVATPGRAVDLLRARRMGLFDLQILVLDEADQMLEASFAQELEYVLDCVPRDVKLQTLMFCATLPQRLLETVTSVCACVRVCTYVCVRMCV